MMKRRIGLVDPVVITILAIGIGLLIIGLSWLDRGEKVSVTDEPCSAAALALWIHTHVFFQTITENLLISGNDGGMYRFVTTDPYLWSKIWNQFDLACGPTERGT